MAVIESVEASSEPSRRRSWRICPSERLEAQICALAGRLAAHECVWLELIGEFDRREGYAAWGCQSTAYWLSWHCGLSKGAARERVRVARALETAAGGARRVRGRPVVVFEGASHHPGRHRGHRDDAGRARAGRHRQPSSNGSVPATAPSRSAPTAVDPAAGEEADADARTVLVDLSMVHDDDG